jgi:predicted nucleotidyltransferase
LSFTGTTSKRKRLTGFPKPHWNDLKPSRSSGEWYMEKMQLQHDFKEFLKFLNDHGVEYLLVGGYAVGYYGYPRATAYMDVWIAVNEENATRVIDALRDFDMPADEETFLLLSEKDQDNIIRMGIPPVRIEVITSASGVDFEECYRRRVPVEVDGIIVNVISLEDLKRNKRASGRYKDLDDLEHLP